MDRHEAAQILNEGLSYTEKMRENARAAGQTLQAAALEKTIAAYTAALVALDLPSYDTVRQLSLLELRYMNGETVWCLELNTEVKIRAPRFGRIYVYYEIPGESGEIKAEDLTLFTRRFPDSSQLCRMEQMRLSTPEQMAGLLLQIADVDALGFCKNLPECVRAPEEEKDIPLERCRGCLVDWLCAPGKLPGMKEDKA